MGSLFKRFAEWIDDKWGAYMWFRNETKADGKGEFPLHGRVCINVREDHALRFEYVLGELRAHAKVRSVPDEAQLGASFAIPGLALYANVSSWRHLSSITKRIGHKVLDVAIHHGGLYWTTPFADPNCSRSDDPWYAWGSIDFADILLGKEAVSRIPVQQPTAVVIPMPEGVYAGSCTIELIGYKRPRWFAKTKKWATVRCDQGVPIPGKGEDAWNLDQDAIYAHSEAAENVHEAVGQFVASVLESRWKYGGPNWEPEPSDPDSAPNAPSSTVPAPVIPSAASVPSFASMN